MKKVFVFILALILSACASPQVTVTFTPQTSEVSETSEVLTATPEPFSQAFIETQQKFAETDIYTLTPLAIEMKQEDGTIKPIEGIVPNTKDGTFTITQEDEEFIVEFESINEKQITFKGEDERIWLWDGNKFVHSYFEDELAQMTDDEKLAAAPETIGDLEKSNLSTVPDKDYLVLYRDKEGTAIKVFNLLTAQELSLPEAGIIEFNLTDGGKFEVIAFISEGDDDAAQIAAIEQMLEFIVADGVAWGDIKEKSMAETPKADWELFEKFWKIPTFTPIGTFILPFTTKGRKIADENRFKINMASVQTDEWGDGTFATFISDEGYRKTIFINIPVARFEDYFINEMVEIPPKP